MSKVIVDTLETQRVLSRVVLIVLALVQTSRVLGVILGVDQTTEA